MNDDITTNNLIDEAGNLALAIFNRTDIPVAFSKIYTEDTGDLVPDTSTNVCIALEYAYAHKPDWTHEHLRRAHDAFHLLQLVALKRASFAPDDPRRAEIHTEVHRLVERFTQIDNDLTHAIASHR
jgi:hypothetical protein